jgi:hypothetical protein
MRKPEMQKPPSKARKTTRKTTRKTVPKTTELAVVETLDAAEARAFPPEAPEPTTENSDTNPTVGHSTAGDVPDLDGASFEGDGTTSQEDEKPTGPQLMSKEAFFQYFPLPFATANSIVEAKTKISLESLIIKPDDEVAKNASDALYNIITKIDFFRDIMDTKNAQYRDYGALALFALGMFSQSRSELTFKQAILVNAKKQDEQENSKEPEKSAKQPKTPEKTPEKNPENMNVQEVTSLSTVVAHEY